LSFDSNEEIVSFVERFDKDTKAIKKQLLQMCWYMRGSITYDDATMLSYEERSIIRDIINDNIETTKESGLPFF
jgi:predicted outer membrane protein